MGKYRQKGLAILTTMILVLLAFSTIPTSASAASQSDDIDTDSGYIHYSYGKYMVKETREDGSPPVRGFDTFFIVKTSYKRDGEYFIIKYSVIVVFTELTLEQWQEAIAWAFSATEEDQEELEWNAQENSNSYTASLIIEPPALDDGSDLPPPDGDDDGPPTSEEEPPEEQWKVMKFLRDYYLEYGVAPMIRKLCKSTGFKLDKIYELFPTGPAKGASKVGGLPKPTGCV